MKILVSALEHSANVHLKSLKKELREDTEFIGIFESGLGKPIVDLRSLAIMGIVDAVKKLRFFFKLADEMVELSREADKVLLIDSSGFNLPLANFTSSMGMEEKTHSHPLTHHRPPLFYPPI
jgi:lipid-A-disaccharide synthase